MKKIYYLAVLVLTAASITVQAQDSVTTSTDKTIYSFVINRAGKNFNFPLIGFTNIADHDHRGLQMGFTNLSNGSFSGLQMGFVNTVKDDVKGIQVGFVNLTNKEFNGVQTGFINNVNQSAKGMQVGFVNNTSQSFNGMQIGFVNHARKNMRGFQLGFVNITENAEGVPLGFLSLVKNGGYKSVALETTEMYPVNLVVRIGVKKLYTIYVGSYNQQLKRQFAAGIGIGSLMPMGYRLYFNPEATLQNTIGAGEQMFNRLTLNMVYHVTNKLAISAGPALTLQYDYDERFGKMPYEPVYTYYTHKVNEQVRFIGGFQAGIRAVF